MLLPYKLKFLLLRMLHDVSLRKFYESWWPWPQKKQETLLTKGLWISKPVKLPNHQSKKPLVQDTPAVIKTERIVKNSHKTKMMSAKVPQTSVHCATWLGAQGTFQWPKKNITFPATQHHQGHVSPWRWPAAPYHHNWVRRSNPHASGLLGWTPEFWSQRFGEVVLMMQIPSQIPSERLRRLNLSTDEAQKNCQAEKSLQIHRMLQYTFSTGKGEDMC